MMLMIYWNYARRSLQRAARRVPEPGRVDDQIRMSRRGRPHIVNIVRKLEQVGRSKTRRCGGGGFRLAQGIAMDGGIQLAEGPRDVAMALMAALGDLTRADIASTKRVLSFRIPVTEERIGKALWGAR
ncbi:hypothetical protein I5535_12300 [Rhodobacteraceae bacterium F11138]|nr:hypothetical protein [Rhodobacteraceae bacterium F11138]